MKNNFDDVVARIRKDEGDAYTNDPDDNGGPTKFGITLADVRLHIKSDATADDVKKLTWDQARNIYKHKYWDALDADNLPSGVDYTCVDYGVNSGLGRPRKVLGKFKSLSGDKLIDAINDERASFLRAIGGGHNAKFEDGWQHRVARVRAYSHVLSSRKSNVAGPTSGAATIGIFAGISQYFHQHMTAILIGGTVAAIVIGTAVHLYKNRNK